MRKYVFYFFIKSMRFNRTYISHEGRLSRNRFFLYNIIIGITLWIIQSILSNIMSITLEPAISLVTSWIWLYLSIALIYKRQHDRGLDWKNKAILLSSSLWLLYIAWFIWNIDSYIWASIASNENITVVYTSVLWILALMSIVFIRPLLFRRWVKWANEYWPDPLEKKIKA